MHLLWFQNTYPLMFEREFRHHHLPFAALHCFPIVFVLFCYVFLFTWEICQGKRENKNKNKIVALLIVSSRQPLSRSIY